MVGRAEVALVTPRWDEPYGLVVAEALACGTPVAAFARGGIPEIVDARAGRLAPADDVPRAGRGGTRRRPVWTGARFAATPRSTAR